MHGVPIKATVARSATATLETLVDDGDFGDLVALLDGVDHGHVLGAAEDGVDAVEVRRGDMGDEELAAAGIATRVGHGECAGRVLLLVDLTLDLVAGTARAGTGGTTALDHESGNDTMEVESVIEAAARELGEIGDGSGGVSFEEIEVDGALAGFHDGFRHKKFLCRGLSP